MAKCIIKKFECCRLYLNNLPLCISSRFNKSCNRQILKRMITCECINIQIIIHALIGRHWTIKLSPNLPIKIIIYATLRVLIIARSRAQAKQQIRS